MKVLLNNKLRASGAVLVAGVLTALTGCAGLGAPVTPEQAVKERAQARWEALIKRDFDKAYTYLEPSYRALNSAEAYGNGRGTIASWTAAEVLDVTCPDADKCTTKVRINVNAPGMPKGLRDINTVVNETWLREDGQWWLFQKL